MMKSEKKFKLTRKFFVLNLLVFLAMIVPAMLLGTDEGSGTEGKVLAELNKAQEKAEALVTYTVIINKQERIKGKLNPTETIFLKWKKPSMVYLKILLGKNKGREIIYVKGKYKNKMIVSPGGLLGRITVRISPYSKIAMKNNRHSIAEAGMASTIGRINSIIKNDMKAAKKTICLSYIGIEKHKEVETIHLRVENSSYAKRTEIYLYTSSYLLYGFYSYNKSGGLLESYTYRHIKADVRLTNHDFDPRNKAYKF